jgi:hypothetical protein
MMRELARSLLLLLHCAPASLVERTAQLRSVKDRAKALPPQIPRNTVLRTRKGKSYSARGFSATWQRVMAKAVSPLPWVNSRLLRTGPGHGEL